MSRPKGFKHSEETRRKMSGSAMGNKNAFGITPSEETREKIRQSKLGKSRPDMIGHKWVVGNTWSRGKVLSSETKQKISEAKKGVSLSAEHKAKLSATAKRGAEHHNWKGGITSEDKKLRSKFQQYTQQLVFQRDNYTCQICDAYGSPIQVDHIKSWAKYPELRFDMTNCRTLCMACHYYITFKRKLPQGVVWGHNLSRRTIKP